MTTNRTDLLDHIFVNVEQFIDELVKKDGTFTNLALLRKVIQDQQQAYIDLLYSFRNEPKPFNATHASIGKRILSVAEKLGYELDETLDRNGKDIFGNPTKEKFYRRK